MRARSRRTLLALAAGVLPVLTAIAVAGAALLGAGPGVIVAVGLLLGLSMWLAIRQALRARDQSSQFAAMVDSAPFGMLLVDDRGAIRRVNRVASELFGYPPLALVGQSIDMLVPDAMRASHAALREEFLTEGHARRMGAARPNIQGLRADGELVSLEVGLAPVHLHEGLRIVAAVVDVSERERAELALRQHVNALSRSNAELEQFAYVASHDLQEPLRTLTTYAEILAETYEGVLDADADEQLHHIVEAAGRMQRLVLDLLALARVSNEDRVMEPVDLNEAVDEVLRNLAARLDATAAELRLSPLPVLEADRVQLVRVLQNLVGNALKFRADRPLSIEISASQARDQVTLCVRDNGVGFDMAHADRIFRACHRLNGRESYDGTGMGLAIVKKIVESHGGRVWAESVPGQGSAFYVSWPHARGQPSRATAGAA